MTSHNENAPCLSGNSAEGEDRNTNTQEGETISMNSHINTSPRTVASTTGTAPLEIVLNGPEVRIYDEAGSGQVYNRAELLDALGVRASRSAVEEPSEAQRAQWEQERLDAQSFDCCFSDCDGSGHDPVAPQDAWVHTVRTFKSGTALIDVNLYDGKFSGYVELDYADDLSADRMREIAGELFPVMGSLLEFADDIDARNGVTV